MVWKHYREDAGNSYRTVDGMKWRESLDGLIKTITVTIAHDLWEEEKFHPNLCEAGMSELMYSREDYLKASENVRKYRRLADKREKIVQNQKEKLRRKRKQRANHPKTYSRTC